MTWKNVIDSGNTQVDFSDKSEVRVTGEELEIIIGTERYEVFSNQENYRIEVDDSGNLEFFINGASTGTINDEEIANLVANIQNREDLDDEEQQFVQSILAYAQKYGWTVNTALALFRIFS